jgi:hypothetical protein
MARNNAYCQPQLVDDYSCPTSIQLGPTMNPIIQPERQFGNYNKEYFLLDMGSLALNNGKGKLFSHWQCAFSVFNHMIILTNTIKNKASSALCKFTPCQL